MTFTEVAHVEGATLTERANFVGATFTERANFAGATFTKEADFRGAKFIRTADFEGATFTKMASFAGTTFTEWTNFGDATFTKETYFVNSEMELVTTFDNASFLDEPPLFDGAKLHEGTTWFQVKWPPSPKTKDQARLAVRAYERLKLEMDRLKKHEDELHFFAMELQARRVLEGKWTSFQGVAIGIYGCLCDYGRSYIRPLWLLGALESVRDHLTF